MDKLGITHLECLDGDKANSIGKADAKKHMFDVTIKEAIHILTERYEPKDASKDAPKDEPVAEESDATTV